MDWFAPLDLYCERTASGLWNEPLNAWSNMAFPLAAAWGGIEAFRRGRLSLLVVALLILAALIGLGSGLFHTHANRWSELADVIPIWSFVALYVLSAIHLVGGVAPGRVLRIGVIAAGVTVAVILLLAMTGDSGTAAGPDMLNGSGQYAPALIALVVFSAVTLRRRHPIAPWVLAATAAFLASLTFRTLDLHLCAQLPHGTHFLWHLLNGLMVGLLMQALIRAPKARMG